ncbi:MAG: hypothetical protein L0215_18275 [Gemmataceae bacterium]|nr:hypothetical protein [Gemmataceae bacterium]
MSFDWKSVLDLAKLQEQQTSTAANPEALQRTAVNRAYFAAFCQTRDYAVRNLGFLAREIADDHANLRQLLKRGKHQGNGKRLERLRQWRNEADYMNALPWADPATTVREAIKDAEALFQNMP